VASGGEYLKRLACVELPHRNRHQCHGPSPNTLPTDEHSPHRCWRCAQHRRKAFAYGFQNSDAINRVHSCQRCNSRSRYGCLVLFSRRSSMINMSSNARHPSVSVPGVLWSRNVHEWADHGGPKRIGILYKQQIVGRRSLCWPSLVWKPRHSRSVNGPHNIRLAAGLQPQVFTMHGTTMNLPSCEPRCCSFRSQYLFR